MLKRQKHGRAIFSHRTCREEEDLQHARDISVICRRKVEDSLLVWHFKTVLDNYVEVFSLSIQHYILPVNTEIWVKTLLIGALGTTNLANFLKI